MRTKFQQNWCASCPSDTACRIDGWPILNATEMCETVPQDWIFYTDGGCCVSNDEPFEMADWIGAICNGSWRRPFDFYGGMAREDWEEWIEPWNWTVRPENAAHEPVGAPDCPNPSHDFAIFAVENIAMTLVGLAWNFIGYRRDDKDPDGQSSPPGIMMRLGNRLTGGQLGEIVRYLRDTRRARRARRARKARLANQHLGFVKRQWSRITRDKIGPLDEYLLWGSGIGSAACSVGANFVNAAIYTHYPGYQNVPLTQLAILWCTRPRAAWLAAILASIDHGPFAQAAASFAITEFILQFFGCVYLGITVNKGRERGFYYVNRLRPFWRGDAAYRMYVGALIWVLGCFPLILLLGWVLLLMRAFSNLWNETKAAKKAEKLAKDLEKTKRDLIAKQGGDHRNETIINGIFRPIFWVLSAFYRSGQSEEEQQQRQPLQQAQNTATQSSSEKLVPGQSRGGVPSANEARRQREVHDYEASRTRRLSLGFLLPIAALSFLAQWLFWTGVVESAGPRWVQLLFGLNWSAQR